MGVQFSPPHSSRAFAARFRELPKNRQLRRLQFFALFSCKMAAAGRKRIFVLHVSAKPDTVAFNAQIHFVTSVPRNTAG